MSKIVIIGGTGLIGTQLVTSLLEGGHQAIPASPATGVDAVTGQGLAEVLVDADVVVDVSNSPSFEEQAVMDFFVSSTTNLLAAARTAGIGHYVALSVVGTERLLESPYFRAKIAQEALIKKSGSAYSLVHATQFFEFVTSIADTATVDGVVHLSPALIQPIAASEVAAAVGQIATNVPIDGTIEVAGPQQFPLDDLVRTGLAFMSDPRTVVADPDARYFGAHLESTTLLPGPDVQLGSTRFQDWAPALSR